MKSNMPISILNLDLTDFVKKKDIFWRETEERKNVSGRIRSTQKTGGFGGSEWTRIP